MLQNEGRVSLTSQMQFAWTAGQMSSSMNSFFRSYMRINFQCVFLAEMPPIYAYRQYKLLRSNFECFFPSSVKVLGYVSKDTRHFRTPPTHLFLTDIRHKCNHFISLLDQPGEDTRCIFDNRPMNLFQGVLKICSNIPRPPEQASRTRPVAEAMVWVGDECRSQVIFVSESDVA